MKELLINWCLENPNTSDALIFVGMITWVVASITMLYFMVRWIIEE